MSTWLVWNPPAGAWAAGLALLLATAVTVWHYRRASSRGPAVWRGLALLLLTLTVFRPAVRYVEPPTLARPLRVVLDDSLSMTAVDATRTPGDWLRVATALGRYDAADTNSLTKDVDRLRGALDDLAQANDALAASRQADPVSTAQRQRASRTRDAALEAVRTLAATAGRAGVESDTSDALRRLEQAVLDSSDAAAASRALEEAASNLSRLARADDEAASAGGAAAEAVWRTAGSTRYELAVAAARAIQARAPAGTEIWTLDGRRADLAASALAAASPLTAALRDACGRAAAGGDEAVVLISDGRATETRSLLATAASTGVAVYAVTVAPEDRTPDARVTRIDARPAVVAGQDVTVRVRVSQRNAAGQSVRVALDDGRRSIERQVTLGPDDNVDFVWPEAAPPRLRLTARVDAIDGESRLSNNSITTEVAVLNLRQRVLLLAGPGGRDITELADALGAASWVDLKRRVLTRGKPEKLVASDFDEADVIVLAEVPKGAIADAAWEPLTRAVRTGGKSLLVLAGRGDWLAEPEVARRLAPLLPTTAGPKPFWVKPKEQVRAVPTRFGTEAAFLRVDESVESSTRAWLGRPKLSRVLAVGPPAATARPLLVDRSTQLPILIEAAAGGGRTMLLLTDEVWQWSATDATRGAARNFWTGLTQTLMDLPYAVQADGLAIHVERADVPVGRSVGVRLRAADPAAGAVSFTVTRRGVPMNVPTPRELLPGGGRFLTTLGLPAGGYELTLRQADRAVRTTLTVQADARVELSDTSADAGFMKRAADATGGRVLALEQIDRLPDLLTRRREREERVGTYALWSSPYGFAAIVACLGMEWSRRPRAGLA